MNSLTNSFQQMLDQLIQALPNVVIALLLLVLAWVVASLVKGIIATGFKKIGVHKLFSRGKPEGSEEKGAEALQSLSSVAYYLVFILFIPSILDALNMNSVSAPISNMMNKVLEFLPNLLAAAIVFTIGWIVAKLIRDLVYRFLNSLNIDRYLSKLTRDEPGEQGATITLVLSRVVFAIILIPIITVTLETLNINTISEPIVNVLNQVLLLIPNIFVAIVLVLAGYYVAKFVSGLLTNLLQRTGINNVYRYVGWERAGKPSFDLAVTIGQIVNVLIIIFFTVEALNVLQLNVLNQIGNAVILYLPLLLSALLILGVGLFVANLLSSWIRKYTQSGLTAGIVKYMIITFAIFMTLDQLQFATSIVNIAFLLILGGLSIAFAISFGVGGRDFAKRQLTKFEQKIEHKPKPHDE